MSIDSEVKPDLTRAGVAHASARRARRAPGVQNLLTALAGVLFAALLASAVKVASLPLRDPDTWWHIIMGHAYLEGTSVRHPGPMSPFGTQDWHSRDWLTQIVVALFDGAFALPGVAWLFGASLVALILVLFRMCRREVPFVLAMLATGMAMAGMVNNISPRPQMVSFILLAVTVGALVRTIDDLRPRWWLVPLTGVWACVHGLWFMSPGIQGLVLIGLLLDRRLDRRTGVRLVGLLAACVAAVAITPNGIYLLTHPTGESLGIAHYIAEYQAPTMESASYLFTLLMFTVVAITWWRRGEVRWVEIVLVVAGMFFALRMARTIPIGTILLLPSFARSLAVWCPDIRATLRPGVERAVVYGGAVLALVALAMLVPGTADRPAKDVPASYDALLDQLPEEAVVINELRDGGYLAWRHPDLRIVGDGLSDQYSVEWMDSWFSALAGQPGWDAFVAESGADYALLLETRPLSWGLLSQGWVTVETGQDRVLLKAPED